MTENYFYAMSHPFCSIRDILQKAVTSLQKTCERQPVVISSLLSSRIRLVPYRNSVLSLCARPERLRCSIGVFSSELFRKRQTGSVGPTSSHCRYSIVDRWRR
uniref:Uncharacterized protein n=1 Tax=Trichuris muris TaxID=70415 RepID=A0A5S6R418_TRIMR